ncbi:MAG: hypothetical protein PHQ58_04745 [Rhodoferax sp.]|uniref:hypothetical protein n=1 Tax=Rhodoferax sp. TaxID=50421 RepID=UPI00261EF06E|nr:hypothetical protein [Rhodoferax sp.]MDD2879721.1 hypothetical protein [Rhodoferax sp.]
MFISQPKCQTFKSTLHRQPYSDQAKAIIDKINAIEEIAFISMSYQKTCRINVVTTREGLDKLMTLLKLLSVSINTAIPKLSIDAFLSSQYRVPVFSFYLPIFNYDELSLAAFDKALDLLNTPNQDDCFVSQDLLDKSRAMPAKHPLAQDGPYASECQRIRQALSQRKGIHCFIAKVENDSTAVLANQLILRSVCTAEGFKDLVDFFVNVEAILEDRAFVTAVFHAAQGVSSSSIHITPLVVLQKDNTKYDFHHVDDSIFRFGEAVVPEKNEPVMTELISERLNECVNKVVAAAEEGYKVD